MSYPDTLLFINGTWRPASTNDWIAVLDPASGLQIGRVAKAERPDLDDALETASGAFADWKRTSPLVRSALMRKAAQLMRHRAGTIARIMSQEQGKPLAQAEGEVLLSADVIDWFAEEARRSYGQVIPARQSGVTQLTIKEAVGPVAAFTPWNFPVNQVARKVALALGAGCTIVVKAAEETPASPAAMVACFADVGLPAGVLNLVYGNPSEISEYLITHPVIKKVSFTGSTAVGKQLASLAGRSMKRVTMELGGHAPVLVFDDADIDLAAKTMAATKFRNAGQVCISPTRFLVQSSVADHFTKAFVQAAENIKIGPWTDPDSAMGPLANERRIFALERLIDDAIERGAVRQTGGRRIGNEGCFFEPTVLADVPSDALLMNEEPFGPIAVINRFADDDDAFVEANRLSYGLAAYGWSGSSARTQRMQDEIGAGMISINHIGLSLPELPFGGIGDSGIGTEGGSEAMEAYLQTRFITRSC